MATCRKNVPPDARPSTKERSTDGKTCSARGEKNNWRTIMKNRIYNLLFGRDSLVSGLFAIAVVGLIALGCTCGKNFDLANIAKNANVASTSDSNDTDDEIAELPDDRLLKALVKETT